MVDVGQAQTCCPARPAVKAFCSPAESIVGPQCPHFTSCLSCRQTWPKVILTVPYNCCLNKVGIWRFGHFGTIPSIFNEQCSSRAPSKTSWSSVGPVPQSNYSLPNSAFRFPSLLSILIKCTAPQSSLKVCFWRFQALAMYSKTLVCEFNLFQKYVYNSKRLCIKANNGNTGDFAQPNNIHIKRVQ